MTDMHNEGRHLRRVAYAKGTLGGAWIESIQGDDDRGFSTVVRSTNGEAFVWTGKNDANDINNTLHVTRDIATDTRPLTVTTDAISHVKVGSVHVQVGLPKASVRLLKQVDDLAMQALRDNGFAYCNITLDVSRDDSGMLGEAFMDMGCEYRDALSPEDMAALDAIEAEESERVRRCVRKAINKARANCSAA